MILIVSSEADGHVSLVADALRRRGAQYTRIDISEFAGQALLTLTVDGRQMDGELCCGLGRLRFESIKSIWYRRPTRPQFAVLPDGIREFAIRETVAALKGAFALLADRLWVSHPDRIEVAQDKIDQLKRAVMHGFTVPRTVVTNDPRVARQFYDELDGNIIYKVLRSPAIDLDGQLLTIYTSRVRAEHLAELGRVSHTPCLFQEYVPKDVEIRVNVIGDVVLSAEIHSQETETTRVDWRYYHPDMTYAVHQLPLSVEDGCRSIVRSYGLNFAAIDLIRRPDGGYTFLELNPNGQWGWIEQATGLPIAETLAQFLDNRG
jgi:glutathione synthase/RimK-type ligase-like ATP-grasp enzyme